MENVGRQGAREAKAVTRKEHLRKGLRAQWIAIVSSSLCTLLNRGQQRGETT